MLKRTLLLTILVFFVRLAEANILVQQAWEAGQLDLATALLYQVYSVRVPDRLPIRFQDNQPPGCATPVLCGVLNSLRMSDIVPSVALKKALGRPVRQISTTTPSGHFRLHYDTIGPHAVDLEDRDMNSVPDYIDFVAAISDSLWEFEIGSLGYRAPPTDGSAGGGPEKDIFISALRNYGYTYPELSGLGSATATSYIDIDNNYTDPIFYQPGQTPGLNGLRVTLAHELFHAVQWGYYYGRDAEWWQEATATWMEDIAYPYIDNYLMYVPHFLGNPELGLDRVGFNSMHSYGAAIFPLFLSQRFGPTVVRRSWEEFDRQGHGRAEALDKVIPGGLSDAFSEFSLWNYFTGSRHRLGAFYVDGEFYTGLRTKQVNTPAKVVVQDSGTLDHLASRYVVIQPQLQPGGVEITVQTSPGQWQNKVVLVASDSVALRSLGADEVRIPDWDLYQEVVVVLAVTDVAGQGYDYDLSVRYDPELGSATVPVAFELHQNRPNPFKPTTHLATVFPFSLARPSQTTR